MNRRGEPQGELPARGGLGGDYPAVEITRVRTRHGHGGAAGIDLDEPGYWLRPTIPADTPAARRIFPVSTDFPLALGPAHYFRPPGHLGYPPRPGSDLAAPGC